MTLINRQQFMSELSKLLTFMFKEDRSEIIQQYNEMLDNAEDEQAMLESFGSPTRLAVAISRSYQRDERKLSVHADSKDGEDGEAVKVKPVIPTQGKKSSAPIIKPNEPEPDAYIDIIEEIRREKAAEEGIEYKPIFFKEEPEPESEPESGKGQGFQRLEDIQLHRYPWCGEIRRLQHLPGPALFGSGQGSFRYHEP